MSFKGFHFVFSHRDVLFLLLILVGFEFSMVVLYLIDAFFQIPPRLFNRFDLNGEATIPSWFSSMQLFVIGVLFLFSKNWTYSTFLFRPSILKLIGFGFIFLSMDEAALIHEKIQRELMQGDWMPSFRIKQGMWITAYAIVAALIALISWRTLFSFWKYYKREAKIILLGLMIFVAGAVGLEIIYYQYLPDGQRALSNKIEIAFEEFFEMLGASIILYGTILCGFKKTTNTNYIQKTT